ncbi:kelch-like protein 20 [Paramacrobiotus metropolitanus]|uniref:kelch-like protein 20 n=1 Tax=Paramacrobiotus metropolitanus TaxID=2943436 RepID=UPI002445C102|nr:kelch-like protein 20 [Paramacrobiotus metropolitanus]
MEIVPSVRLKLNPDSNLQDIPHLDIGGPLCDLRVRGTEQQEGIACHRHVVSSQIGYFRLLFASGMKESRQEDIWLRNIPNDNLQALINYAYGLEIIIDNDNVQSLLDAAIFLDVPAVADACWAFVESQLNETNCLMVYCLAECDTRTRPRLEKKAKAMVFRHFSEISQGQDFLELDKDKLSQILRSDLLSVEHEDEVYRAVVRWTDHDPGSRKLEVPDLLKHIRYLFLSPSILPVFLGLSNAVTPKRDEHDAEKANSLSDLPKSLAESIFGSTCRPRRSYGFDNVTVCVGGKNRGYRLDCVDCFNPLTSSWSKMSSLPDTVNGIGMAVMEDDTLLVCGGFNVVQDGISLVTKRALRYDFSTNNWNDIPELQTARGTPCAAAIGGRVYVVGGCGSHNAQWTDYVPMQTVECYDPMTNCWTYVAPLPIPLDNFAMVAYDDRLYTFGGYNADGVLDAVLCYDPSLDKWTELAKLPTARHWCSASVGSSGLIYVIGGVSGAMPDMDTESLSCVEAYDPVANQWHKKDDMHIPRYNAGIACLNDKIYVLGGVSQQYGSAIEMYDEATGTWAIYDSQLPSAREAFGCAVIGIPKG